MADMLPDHYTAPVCKALIAPHLVGGVPRNFFHLNCTVTLGAVVGLHWWWMIAVGLGLYALMRIATRFDPYFMQTLPRALGDKPLYEA